MQDIDRFKKLSQFAKKTPEFINCSFLASDMSKRKYYRVTTQNSSFVLMDASDLEELSRYIKIQNYLLDMNIKAPKTFDQDLENGFLLIEDFGDTTLTLALKDPTLKRYEYDYYNQSIRILHDIQKNYNQQDFPLLNYSKEEHLKEASLFSAYYFAYVHKQQISDTVQKDWINLWDKALTDVLTIAPSTLVLRDYHVDNLVLLKNGHFGVLDFQDALYGSILYDYISLIEDARRILDDALILKITNDFLCIYDPSKHQDYLYHAAVIGACRHAKILGVFTRYASLYNNDSKLTYIPHVFNLFINALKRSEQIELLYFLKDQGFLK